MNIKSKLILIFLIPAIGMIYFSSYYVYEKFTQYRSTNFLESSILYVKSCSSLIKELQKERGLSIAFLASKKKDIYNVLKKQRLNTNLTLNKYKNIIIKIDYLENSKNIRNFLDKNKKLYEIRKNIDNKNIESFEVLDFYSDLISNLIDSTYILDKYFINETFFKYIQSFKYILNLTEISGKQRALISYLLEKNDKKILYELIKLEALYKEFCKKFKNDSPISVIVLYDNTIPYDLEKEYKDIKKSIIFNKEKIDTLKWWDISTTFINYLYKINDKILDDTLIIKNSIKKEAVKSLIISLFLWIASIISLYILILIIKNLLKRYENFLNILEKEKILFKTFSNFSENILYSKNEDTLLNSLIEQLHKTDKFKYIWIAKIKDNKVEPILSKNISLEIIKKELKNGNFEYIEKSIKDKNFILYSNLDGDKILYKGIKNIISIPIEKFGKIEYVLILANIEDRVDEKILDLLNKLSKALSFALEKIEIERKQKSLKEELNIIIQAFNTHEAITITDVTGKIVKINDAFTKITGYKEEEVIGKYPSILKSGKHDKKFYEEMWEKIRKNGYWKGEIYNKRKNGEIYPELLSISTIKDNKDEITNYVAHFFDISDIKEAQKKAEYRAYHDPLTNVYNRQKLFEELEKIYKKAKNEGFYNAFLFIDIDNFKYINDYYTHEIGDKVLIKITEKLKKFLKDDDILARIGGDEFAFIAYNLGDNKSLAIKNASILIEKIKNSFNETLEIDGNSIDISFSIGVKIFPDNENSFKDIIAHADIAMYQAKKNGKNQFHFFNEELDIESKKFLIIKNELNCAIKNRELVLHYQPKVDIKDNKIVGFESLIRWNHLKRGLLYPNRFLYVTNGNRLIYLIGDYVLKEVCSQIMIWQEKYKNFDKKISVNISAEQFNFKNFEYNTLKILDIYKIDPSFLEFEIVEDALLKDKKRAIDIINNFKKIGITFSMDDFGKGYSSINYLKNLPFDYVKIDKDFVIDLFKDKNYEIVNMIIQTSKIFDLKTVAEGVETKESLEFLKEAGCDLYQGFYFSRALPASEIEKKFLD